MKQIFTLLSIFFINFQLFATHLMGGEIVVQHDQGNNYEILLTLYRDTLGIQINNTQDFTIYDANGNQVITATSILDPMSMHPIFGLQNGSVLPMFPYGVEVYHYSAIVSLPNAGTYTVSWSNCCRNAAIQNLPNPSSNDLQLFTEFTVYGNNNMPPLNFSNSSPFFMVKPVVFLPVNTPWQYNPLPFDPDGDSLSWSLGVPHEENIGSPTGIPISGYTNPPSASGTSFSIDPLTGTISWTASVQGNFVYTVTCEEFRNGLKIGEIRRDMQFIVLPPGPVPQLLPTNTLSSTFNGVPLALAMADYPFTLNLFAVDSSVSTILAEAFGEPFVLNNPMTYIQGTTDDPFKTKLSLMWSPTDNEARENPYLVVIRLMNGTFSMDYSIYVKVAENNVGVEELKSNIGNIFPNPSSSLISIPVFLKSNQEVKVNIYDNVGKIMKSINENFLMGNHCLMIQNQFINGNYIVETILEDGTRNVQQLIVVN
ncbi:MAG: hypothetical protein CL846_05665 [Crocinitomicaceae bacterium]|nr:hypothetical protein [Crocinitomicaceae bacterium]